MYFIIKRIFDIIFSLFALILLSPLFILITIILLLTAERQVFYFQKRIGLNNAEFYIWKFATMLKNSLSMGTGSITVKNDFRVTKFGFFLRKTKLNELPQLFNVLKGDISFIGPRPLVFSTFHAYPKKIRENIYNIPPGISGIGSIVFRDEEEIISNVDITQVHEFYRNKIAPYKGQLEMWYQQKKSIRIDLLLIILTIIAIIFPKLNLHFKVFKDLPKRNF